ncbi:diaminopimelate epimerase [Natronospira proteinivora]|uniref:Diaminopimelate epimerase n=1 Tax=Natronospira proteinivora TaxID=1807133 RepID=A0ABT1G9W0_9GAMM|nr:diaminopimelate epimerase [Natronospira proteinivora]MCP1728120.1 diaminopimelate epimerase [Natronospira proteinivora]
MDFFKMQGLGNDFVVIDAVKTPVTLSAEQVRHIAHRRYGVGCDQLLILEAARDEESDFYYRVYNADGGEVAQCGNGARCVARLAMDQGHIETGPVRLRTRTGLMRAEPAEGGQIRVDMGLPRFQPVDLPAKLDDNPAIIQIEDRAPMLHLVDMGNPHAVIRVDSVLDAPVDSLGPALEHHAAFPEGVNVGFMVVDNPEKVSLRVWERGVGETLACGSGACAAVAAGRVAGWLESSVKVRLQGGELMISFEGDGRPLWMQGPAEYAFTGSIRL